MIKLSGSKIHRAWRCPASAVLPQNASDEREERTEPARGRGKGVHRFLERVKAIGRDAALGEVPLEIAPLCRALDLDKLPVNLACEVAYAWNWKTRTARELGRGLEHREYHLLDNPPDPACEVPCTLDAVGLSVGTVSGTPHRRGYYGEYKTGRTRYPRPDSYGQTLIGACCIRSVMRCDSVTAELLYLDEHGDCWPVRDTIDGWLLDQFEIELQDMYARIAELEADQAAGISLPVTEGDHCDYCQAYKHCSAKVALVRSIPAELARMGVSNAGDGGLVLNTASITAANAAVFYAAVERIEDVLGKIKTEICGLGYHHPIELPDGRVIEPYKTERRALDGKIAAAVAERKYPRERVLQAIDISMSIDALRKMITEGIDPAVKPRQVVESKAKKNGLLDVMLAEIDAAGGLAVTTTEACKPHMPKGSKKLPSGNAG